MLRQAQHERFLALPQLVSSPFALSSPHSGRVEGLSTCQLRFLGLMLAMDAENLEAFRRVAESLGMMPVLPVSMKDFADPATLQRWINEKHMLAFALRPQESSAPTIDILVHPKVAFDMAWARHVEKNLGDIHVRLVHIDDLIALKTGTGRQRDVADIAALERLKTLGRG